jgi:Exostosin family
MLHHHHYHHHYHRQQQTRMTTTHPRVSSLSRPLKSRANVVTSTSTIHRRLGLQVIIVTILLLLNRRMLVSYHTNSSTTTLLMSSSANTDFVLPNTILLLNDTTKFTSPSSNGVTTNATTTATNTTASATFKFYILNVPNMTTALLKRYGKGKAEKAYSRFFNEDRAEMWLHRGLSSFTHEQGQTLDPMEADVFFIPGYLHYRRSLFENKESEKVIQQQHEQALTEQVISVLVNKTKPHVLLIPTRDTSMNRNIGLNGLVQGLQSTGVNLYTVGFERNSLWQTVETNRIIPIPYVVQPPPPPPIPPVPKADVVSSLTVNNNISRDNVGSNDGSNSSRSMSAVPITFQDNRTENFVFLSAHPRPNAMSWSGCNRSMVSPLTGERDDMDIRLVSDVILGVGAEATAATRRMTQKHYNHRMQTSDYCLILCGDTPTSRSLASAMMAGCIPLRVGSWWRGLCEPPCRLRYGWTIANQPHFPFANDIDWSLFPELNETLFAHDPLQTLHDFFHQANTTRGRQDKQRARTEMKRVQTAWNYGWGNPVTSRQFGDLYSYLWKSTLHEVGLLS